MDQTKTQLTVLQTVVPHYRVRLFGVLRSRLGDGLRLVAGDEYFDKDLQTSDEIRPLVHNVSNRFLFGRRLLWQSGAFREVVPASAALVELNPRVLTTWLVLLTRTVLRRHTVLWGHAWARRGRYRLSFSVRWVMWRLASCVLLYTETEAADVKAAAKGRATVIACPNALYSREEMYATTSPDACGFLCVGRLIEIKRPLVLLEAFQIALPALGVDAALTYVGDGPLRPELEARIVDSGLSGHVVLLGHVDALDELRSLHARVLATVSAGRAGLSMTQSFGFGVPMVVGWPWEHGPEVEALRDGVNGVRTKSDTAGDLATALRDAAEHREHWLSRREAISRECAAVYSVEGMVERILKATARA